MVDGYGGALYNKLIYYLKHGGMAFMWIAKDWQDYELLDCGGGEKLERWDKQYLVRPDPQAIWETPRRLPEWKRANARYLRSQTFLQRRRPLGQGEAAGELAHPL